MADWFVDFSAANDGDGTAYTQAASGGATGAYNTLVGKTFSSGDKVWLRRQSKTLTATLTLSTAGVIYIGWPKSGDPYYSTRPSGAQASWDPDAANFAEIKCTATVTTSLLAVSTGTGQEFHGIQVTQGITSSQSIDALALSIAAKFFRCQIENQNNSATSTTPRVVNYSGTGQAQFWNSTLLYSGTCSSSGSGAGTPVFLSGSGSLELLNCTVRQSASSWNPTNAAASQAAGLISVVSSSGALYAIGCTLISNSTNYAGKTNGSGLVVCNQSGGSVYLQDVTIQTDSTGQSASLQIASGAVFEGLRVSFDPVCYIRLASNGGRLHIAKYNQTVAVASGFSIDITGSGNVLSGHNISFASSNASGDMQLSGTNGNAVYLSNVTFAAATPFGASPGLFTGVWCADYGGTVGLWKFFGPHGEITSTNVARSGGETFGLKYEMTAGSTGDPLWRSLLPTFPQFETVFVPVTPGMTTITLYGAHKGYGATPPDASDIWMEVDYLDQSSGSRRAFSSTRDSSMLPAALTADGSTWNGDSSLTAFRLQVSINPQQSCLVPVRLFFKKRVASAYWYLDPKPVAA